MIMILPSYHSGLHSQMITTPAHLHIYASINFFITEMNTCQAMRSNGSSLF